MYTLLISRMDKTDEKKSLIKSMFKNGCLPDNLACVVDWKMYFIIIQLKIS